MGCPRWARAVAHAWDTAAASAAPALSPHGEWVVLISLRATVPDAISLKAQQLWGGLACCLAIYI